MYVAYFLKVAAVTWCLLKVMCYGHDRVGVRVFVGAVVVRGSRLGVGWAFIVASGGRT